MADTIINVPYLTPGLTYTLDVLKASDLSVAASGIALTLTSDATGATGSGTVAAAVDYKALFVVKNGGNNVEAVPRVRTIADDAGPYTILTGLDSAVAGGELPPLVDPTDGIDCATGWIVCKDEACQPEDGVEITIQLTSGNGIAGLSLDTEPRTGTSATVEIDGEDVVGYVAFPGLPFGTTWSIVRGDGSTPSTTSAGSFGNRSDSAPGTFLVPTTFADPDEPLFALPQVLGRE